MAGVSALLALLALGATIFFFHRLNTRRGKLSTSRPLSFGYQAGDGLLLVRLPLVLYNDGAVPLIIQDLRLQIDKTPALQRRQRKADEEYLRRNADDYAEGTVLEPDTRERRLTLQWRESHDGMQPTSVVSMPTVFAVPGRATHTIFVSFAIGRLAKPPLGEQRATLLCRLAHKKGWVVLDTFDMHPPFAMLNPKYTVYPNEDEFSEGDAASGG